MIKDHKNVRKNILELVKIYPGVKTSYNKLVMHYWLIFDGVKTMKDVSSATPVESINRAFRKLVEVGQIILPADEVERRRAAEKIYKYDFTQL